MKTKYKSCLEIAREAHKGQTRWDKSEYILHPIAVASKLKEEKLKCIAALHDVIEDTMFSKEILLEKGVDKEIIKIVEILSRKKGESYRDFIMRVCLNHDAIKVKTEDIKHNLSDLKGGSLRDKYELSLTLLKIYLRWL